MAAYPLSDITGVSPDRVRQEALRSLKSEIKIQENLDAELRKAAAEGLRPSSVADYVERAMVGEHLLPSLRDYLNTVGQDLDNTREMLVRMRETTQQYRSAAVRELVRYRPWRHNSTSEMANISNRAEADAKAKMVELFDNVLAQLTWGDNVLDEYEWAVKVNEWDAGLKASFDQITSNGMLTGLRSMERHYTVVVGYRFGARRWEIYDVRNAQLVFSNPDKDTAVMEAIKMGSRELVAKYGERKAK